MTRGAESARPWVELLWFQDCPNHAVARALLEEILTALAPGTIVNDIDATDPTVARRHRFPGSPTIRIDGRDVDPSYQDPGDYTPRCRLYRTADGLRGVPQRSWIEDALRASLPSRRQPGRSWRRPEMRLSVRSVPWLLALAGLVIPLVGSGFVVWPLVLVWLVILALIWIVGQAALPRGRTSRVALAVGLVPVLFLLGWEGGWWLIPADLAWLVIELADRGEATGEAIAPDATV